MGRVMDLAKGYSQFYDGAKFLTQPGGNKSIDTALMNPGKTAMDQLLAQMDGNQLANLILKLDSIYRGDVSHPIANMVGASLPAIVNLVQIIGGAAAGSSKFTGILASGQEMDVWPFRPKDSGGPFLNGAGVAAKGLYGGVSGGVFSWDQPVVAGVAQTIIPTQTTSGQSPFGGLAILGFMERKYTPKIESISLVLQGQPSGTVPAQPVAMDAKRTFGEDNDISLAWLEKPVIITQNESFGMQIMPNASGACNFSIIGVMTGQVQNKVF